MVNYSFLTLNGKNLFFNVTEKALRTTAVIDIGSREDEYQKYSRSVITWKLEMRL